MSNPSRAEAGSRWLWLLAAIVSLAICGIAQGAAGNSASEKLKPRSVLILPFDMVDTGPEADRNHGPLKEDVARLRRTQTIFRKQVQKLAAFHVVEPAEQAKSAIRTAEHTYRYLYRCNGCELDIGEKAGVGLVMTGWVQKVSNLILNFNVALRDVNTGKTVAGGSVSLRGDTDESWRDAAIYFANHNLIDSYRAWRSSPAASDRPSQADK